ncbi:MAG: hypothetical protein KMY55_14020 [Dethiosulfatibacter sp.]|nr:hypothetical protein [Dethiosulfatibacter sp.]
MKNFEKIAYDYYGDVIINKSLIQKAGFSSRAIPTYVGEWILYNFLEEGELTDEARTKISNFISRFLPQKGQKEEVKNRLLNMESVRLLNDYSVYIDLKTGKRTLVIPFLDSKDSLLTSHTLSHSIVCSLFFLY